jgi:hypothetical protein
MRSTLGIALAVAATTAGPRLAAADCRPPASDLVTQSRTVHGFREIDLSAPAHLVLKQGARESMSVRTDRRLLPYLRTQVRSGRLEIDLDHHDLRRTFHDDECLHDTVIEVTVPTLSGVSVSGAGSVEIPSWTGQRFALDLSGAGSVVLRRASLAELDIGISGAGSLTAAGQASRQKVDIAGAGNFSGERLATQSAAVSISGTGNARVNVSKTLDVSISGVGNVGYLGNPRIRQSISGMGTLAQLKR